MRKLALIILSLFWAGAAYANPITVDAFYSPDDVTIAHLETFRTAVVNGINNADGGLLQARTVTPEKMTKNGDVTIWRDEAFNDFVYSGLIMPTSASLTTTTTSGVAYAGGQRIEKDATANTYTATKFTYVDMDQNGTYTYTEVTPDSAPALANNCVRLAKVETNSSAVVAVTDLRVLSITVENRQADFYRVGLNIGVSTPDIIRISPGVVYHGNIRICKTSNTNLNLGTAGDWTGGARANNTMGFVAVNNAGSIKLTTTAPTLHDLAGTTAGKKRYSDVAGAYWRILAYFYMNNTGSGNIDFWNFADYCDGANSLQMNWVSRDTAISVKAWTDIPGTTINFYTAGGKIKIKGYSVNGTDQQHYGTELGVKVDSQTFEFTSAANSCTTVSVGALPSHGSVAIEFVTPELASGSHTANLIHRQVNEYNGYTNKATIVYEEVE